MVIRAISKCQQHAVNFEFHKLTFGLQGCFSQFVQFSIGSCCIELRLKRSNDFQAIVSFFFCLRNTLIIDNSYKLNFPATTNLKQVLLPLFVKSLWSFFFDNISFGFVVVFIYKKVKHKIAQVNTPLHLIWQYRKLMEIKFYICVSNILQSAVLYKTVKQQSYSRLQDSINIRLSNRKRFPCLHSLI